MAIDEIYGEVSEIDENIIDIAYTRSALWNSIRGPKHCVQLSLIDLEEEYDALRRAVTATHPDTSYCIKTIGQSDKSELVYLGEKIDAKLVVVKRLSETSKNLAKVSLYTGDERYYYPGSVNNLVKLVIH